MKKPHQKALVLAVGIVVMLITGCEEQNLSDKESDTKKSRLIAAENIQLKEEIKKQKTLYDREIRKQKELLDKCLEGKKALAAQSGKVLEEMMDKVIIGIAEENERLRKENEEFKAEIGQLKTEIMELERELEKHKGPEPL